MIPFSVHFVNPSFGVGMLTAKGTSYLNVNLVSLKVSSIDEGLNLGSGSPEPLSSRCPEGKQCLYRAGTVSTHTLTATLASLS